MAAGLPSIDERSEFAEVLRYVDSNLDIGKLATRGVTYSQIAACLDHAIINGYAQTIDGRVSLTDLGKKRLALTRSTRAADWVLPLESFRQDKVPLDSVVLPGLEFFGSRGAQTSSQCDESRRVGESLTLGELGFEPPERATETGVSLARSVDEPQLRRVLGRTCLVEPSAPLEPSLVNSAFAEAFLYRAREAGFSSRQIAICLTYAQALKRRSLPVIFDVSHFCGLVGFQFRYVRNASRSSRRYYRIFGIPKKREGTRTIAEPLPNLKEIQRWILENILNHVAVSAYAKAYAKGRSPKAGARLHCKQPVLLTVDIKEFFSSISSDRVRVLFEGLGYHRTVAKLLAGLCTLDGSLPQGAPTSPALSNLICRRLDARIAGYCKRRRIRYTRYADDIALSGCFQPGQLISLVATVLASEGLRLNETKTRVARKNNRQVVTGIVVNRRPHPPRAYRRAIRQSAFYIERHGLFGHMQNRGLSKANHASFLFGCAQWALFLNPADRDALKLAGVLQREGFESRVRT